MGSYHFFSKKNRFLIGNILKGFLAFGIFVLALYLLRANFAESERFAWVQPLYEKPLLIMAIFIGSELLFGVIPPELFMLWSLQTAYLGPYFTSIGILATISYGAGILNFFIGRFLKERIEWLNGKARFVKKYKRLFAEHGGQLVVVAAISPLPFSLIALLGGAGGLKRRKYLLYSLARFIRYFLYAFLLWKLES